MLKENGADPDHEDRWATEVSEDRLVCPAPKDLLVRMEYLANQARKECKVNEA